MATGNFSDNENTDPKLQVTGQILNVSRDNRFCVECKKEFSALSEEWNFHTREGHKIKSSSDFRNEMKKNFGRLKEVVEGKISFLLLEQFKLQQTAILHKINSDSIKTAIQDYETKLKEIISMGAKSLLDQNNEFYENTNIKIEDQRANVENQISWLREMANNINLSTDSENIEEMLEISEKFQTKVEDIELTNTVIPTASLAFKGQPIEDFSIRCSLQTANLAEDIRFETIEQYSTDILLIDKIIACVDESFCIHDYHKSTLKVVELDHQEIKVNSTHKKFDIIDMAIAKTDDLYISVRHDSTIKVLTKAGTVSDFYTFQKTENTKRLRPTCLHACQDGDLLIGTKEAGGSEYSISANMCRQIVVLNTERREIKKAYEFDSSEIRLFTYPLRVALLPNGTISTLDKISSSSGRVITFDQQGSVKWIHCSNGTSKALDPCDMAVTKNGYILVTDTYCHAILLLDSNGNLLKLHHTKELDINYPYSLAVDSTGKVIVGCWSQSKLYRLKIKGTLESIINGC